MIKFIKLSSEIPYSIFKEKMSLAYNVGQENIDAVCISSYSKTHKEVDSRYVNLKFIKGREFIFFSNYSSTKALQFNEHNQISAVFYWNKADIQIRIKGKIHKNTRVVAAPAIRGGGISPAVPLREQIGFRIG